MLSGSVQVRSFRREWETPTAPNTVDNLIGSLWDEANTFLATVDPANVLDIRYTVDPVSKYDSSYLCHVTVIYYQP